MASSKPGILEELKKYAPWVLASIVSSSIIVVTYILSAMEILPNLYYQPHIYDYIFASLGLLFSSLGFYLRHARKSVLAALAGGFGLGIITFLIPALVALGFTFLARNTGNSGCSSGCHNYSGILYLFLIFFALLGWIPVAAFAAACALFGFAIHFVWEKIRQAQGKK